MGKFTVNTSGREVLLDITSQVREEVRNSGVQDGICVVFVPHTTAAVTINENADPDVKSDISMFLEKLVPQSSGFLHAEGNSDSHIKSSMMGFSETIIVQNGKPVLGTWQGVCLAEFDGPRTRKVYVKVIPG